MRIVVDTNVLVSGLLTPTGFPARVVDAITTGTITLAFDDRILAEWRQVLHRPAFGFDPPNVARFLTNLKQCGVPVVAPPLGLALPDPDDLPFAEVAVAAAADALVTGNGKHFVPRSGELPVAVLSPRQLIQRLMESRAAGSN